MRLAEWFDDLFYLFELFSRGIFTSGPSPFPPAEEYLSSDVSITGESNGISVGCVF